VVAVGLAAYGVYMLTAARYSRIVTDMWSVMHIICRQHPESLGHYSCAYPPFPKPYLALRQLEQQRAQWLADRLEVVQSDQAVWTTDQPAMQPMQQLVALVLVALQMASRVKRDAADADRSLDSSRQR
jgi:hypothetical protein